MKDHRVNGVQWPTLLVCQVIHHPAGDRGNGLLGDLDAVDLGQVRGDFSVRQPFATGRLPCRPPAPVSRRCRLATIADSKLESPSPRHRDLRRPGIGQHRLGSVFRVVLAIAEMVIQLAFLRALDDHHGQPAHQVVLVASRSPAGTDPLVELPQCLLIGRRQLPRSRWS